MNNIEIKLKPCFETFPCQHWCKITKNDGNTEDKILSGTKIYQFLKENNLPIPQHFQEYAHHNQNNN